MAVLHFLVVQQAIVDVVGGVARPENCDIPGDKNDDDPTPTMATAMLADQVEYDTSSSFLVEARSWLIQ